MLTRREFLAGAAAAIVPGTRVSDAQAQESAKLFDILRPFEFMDEDGNPVDMEALRAAVKDKFVTVSFGFSGCSTMCPISLNPNLAAIGGIAPDKIVSLAINVTPETEGDPVFRQEFRRSIELHEPKQTLIPLFPMQNGVPSNDASVRIQHAFEQLIHTKDPNQHSFYILLFGPDGEKLAEKSSLATPEEFVGEWSDHITPPSRQRGR